MLSASRPAIGETTTMTARLSDRMVVFGRDGRAL
jgi:hypothetical protein